MDAELFELSERAREEGASIKRQRFIFSRLNLLLGERVFPGLVGPRGCGKTILLKSLLSQRPDASFYISLDSTTLEQGLFNTAKELSDSGTRFLFLDEVHAYSGGNFSGELKKIYDFLPSLNVAFTSSSALSLSETSHDLSRRVRIVPIRPFSFREFVFFEKNELLPAIPFKDLLDERKSREAYGKAMRFEGLFKKYLSGGNYPFTLSKTLGTLPLFRSILDKIIEKDLILSGRATPEEAMQLRAALLFSGKSPVEDISPSSIAKNLGITKYKAEKYVSLLETAFVLKRIMPLGTNVTREPKILFSPPYRLLYKDYESSIGALREDFFAEAMESAGMTTHYLKTMRGEKTPDYSVDGTIIEVGGASKSTEQFKGYSSKKRLILGQASPIDRTRRPLLLAGFLERDLETY